MDLDSYRERCEQFLAELERAYYLHLSGQTQHLAIEAIYARYAELFFPEAAKSLRERSSRALAEFAAYGCIARATSAQEAELAHAEATLEIEADGERVGFRTLQARLANEPQPARRAELEQRRLELVETQLNPQLVDAHRVACQTAQTLGYESLMAASQDLSGIDLSALAVQTKRFLQVTESVFENELEPQLVTHLGYGFEMLRRSDLPAFFRAPKLDRYFAKDRLIDSLEATLRNLGIDLNAQSNVIVDQALRPTKSPRAFCAPVRVPEEVYLVIKPIGGRDDYETLLHEAGHVEHYAHVDRSLAVEARRLGDNSVTEAFAFLFQYLAADENWLGRCLGIADPEPITAQAKAVKLVFLRRYAAKLVYELELQAASSSYANLRQVYSSLLSEALHLRWPDEMFLSDVDPFFYSARYLRAWALEAKLRNRLVQSFGKLWFESESAGTWLRELWQAGQGTGADDLARALDGEGLAFDVLADQWTAGA